MGDLTWARDNLVLVYVDFPRQDCRSKQVQRQNQELDQRYQVSSYPTLVLTDADGREITRLSYMQGGPKTFIRAIQRALKTDRDKAAKDPS